MTRAVTIRGTVYPSQRAAADALGVTPATISAAAQALGLPLSAVCGYARVADPEPVTIAGRSYASMSAAARDLGVKPAEIRAWQKLQSIISGLA